MSSLCMSSLCMGFLLELCVKLDEFYGVSALVGILRFFFLGKLFYFLIFKSFPFWKILVIIFL